MKQRAGGGGRPVKVDGKAGRGMSPPASPPGLSPSRVMLPTELELKPPTRQFGNV